MDENMRYNLRYQVQYRLVDYLEKAHLFLDNTNHEDIRAVCPVCFQQASVIVIPLEQPQSRWHCHFCGNSGDAVDYVMHYFHMEEEDAIFNICRKLAIRVGILRTFTAQELMAMEFAPKKEIVEGMLTKGLYVNAGASKVGKSWLALQLANAVSQGLPIWERKTLQGEVLYLALEDTRQRLQDRLDSISGGHFGNITFAIESEIMNQGFEESLIYHLQNHPNTLLVIVDTLGKIWALRDTRYSYAGDYAMMGVLKNLADRFHICLLVIHHTRKMEDADYVNQVSGTMGIMGAADGILVLKNDARGSSNAVLEFTGRDFPDGRIALCRNSQTHGWDCLGEAEETEETQNPVLEAVSILVEQNGPWKGPAGPLLEKLKEIDPSLRIQPNHLSHQLKRNEKLLKQRYGLLFRRGRDGDNRTILLTPADDGDDPA